MAYTGKKPIDVVDATTAQSLEVTTALEVDTIKDTGGTTAIEIDSGGRVFTPARPAFFSYLSGNYDITANATDEKIVFNAEDFDKGNNFASGQFTAPVAGLYQFNVCITYFGEGVSSRYVRASIYKNGSDALIEGHGQQSDETGNADYSMVSFSAIMDLAVDDVISVYVAVNDSAVSVAGFNKTTHFSGYLIG